MSNKTIQNITELVRSFLFRLLNKEFLIFLFFLILSGSFWLVMTLNETYEREIKIPVRIVDIPDNVVITSDETDTLGVVLRDKGYSLWAYIYGSKIQEVDISYKVYSKKNGTGQVSTSELQRLIYQKLFGSSHIVSIKPNKFEFFYNYGTKKRVPVKLYGKVEAAQSHYLENVELRPTHIDVYGSDEVLDTIHFAYTEMQNITNITDTLLKTIELKKIKGVKFVPHTVKLYVCSDVLMEESVDIPVTALNMPEGKVLRTFPSKVKVTFTVGAGMFRKIHPENFRVTADYKEIMADKSDKCTLQLSTVPPEVRNARIDISHVDYLLEEK